MVTAHGGRAEAPDHRDHCTIGGESSYGQGAASDRGVCAEAIGPVVQETARFRGARKGGLADSVPGPAQGLSETAHAGEVGPLCRLEAAREEEGHGRSHERGSGVIIGVDRCSFSWGISGEQGFNA